MNWLKNGFQSHVNYGDSMNNSIQFVPEGAMPIEPDDMADLIPNPVY